MKLLANLGRQVYRRLAGAAELMCFFHLVPGGHFGGHRLAETPSSLSAQRPFVVWLIFPSDLACADSFLLNLQERSAASVRPGGCSLDWPVCWHGGQPKAALLPV